MEEYSKKELNREFYRFYLESSLPNMRNGMLFTTLLFILFALASSIFLKNKAENEYYIRFGSAIPFLLISVIVMYVRPLRKHLNLIYIIINLLLCLTIFLVGLTSKPDQPGYEHYYAWVMLTIMDFYIFYRLSPRILIAIGMIQLFAYLFATILNGSYSYNPERFLTSLFFVVAISSLGYFMTFLIQSLNRKNFIHQKALSENNRKLLNEIKERKRAVEDHLRIAKQYADTLDSIPDLIFVVDEQQRFVMINTALREEHIRKGFLQDLIGQRMTDEYPLISEKTIADIHNVFSGGKILISEQQFDLSDRTIYGEIRNVPVFKDNKVALVITIIRDRSKEKEVEELKLRNAEQKEVMLREIHHRVKNNLAIVISLLNLQEQRHPSMDLRRIMKDIELRIRSMALIHEHLYHSENLDHIPLANYIRDLSTIILSTFSGKRIHIENNLDPIDVTIETALPIGLITNELLTNAFKYAFPNRTEGTIYIDLKKSDENDCLLIVRDDGFGLPPDFSLQHQNSLGMFIIRILVEQVDGSVSFSSDNGAVFSIRFKNQGGLRRMNNVNH